MALIEWSADLFTGIESVDKQHRQLVDIINKFDSAVQKAKGSRIMNEILKDLIGYTSQHFSAEEELMEQAGYSNIKQHKNQHRQLLQKVERLQFEFDQQGKRKTVEVRNMLKYWLTNHILKEDMAYVPSLTSSEKIPQ